MLPCSSTIFFFFYFFLFFFFKDKETLETLQPKNMLTEETIRAVAVARTPEGRSSVSL